MSIDAALFGYLTDNLSIAQTRDPKPVYPMGKRPQDDPLPGVTYMLVSGPGSHYSHGGVSDREVSYQLDSWGTDPDDVMDLDSELRSLLDGFRGMWGDYPIGSVLLTFVMDDYEPKTGLYRRMRQADVHYREPEGS